MTTDADAVWGGIEELVQAFGRWGARYPDASTEQIETVACDIFGLDVTVTAVPASTDRAQRQEIVVARKLGDVRVIGVTFASGHLVAVRTS